MDNATYDELDLTPISNDETYSRLRMTHNKIKTSDDLTRRADIHQNPTKGVKQTSTKRSTKQYKSHHCSDNHYNDIDASFYCTVCGNLQSIDI